MKIEPKGERYVAKLRFREAEIASLAVMCLLIFGALDAKAITCANCAAVIQEKPQNKQEQTAKDEKEPTTVITGIVVNQRGLPLKGQVVELYMVVNGIARDAYGAPLRGAITVWPQAADHGNVDVSRENRDRRHGQIFDGTTKVHDGAFGC